MLIFSFYALFHKYIFLFISYSVHIMSIFCSFFSFFFCIFVDALALFLNRKTGKDPSRCSCPLKGRFISFLGFLFCMEFVLRHTEKRGSYSWQLFNFCWAQIRIIVERILHNRSCGPGSSPILLACGACCADFRSVSCGQLETQIALLKACPKQHDFQTCAAS